MFENELKQWLLDTGCSIRCLAGDAGVSDKTIDNFLYNKPGDIKVETAMRIKEATKVRGHKKYKDGLEPWQYIESLHELREVLKRK
jgi:hypothetical protein